MSGESFEVTPIGIVESTLLELDAAPRQGDEGAPEAWLRFEPRMRAGLDGLRPGDEVVVLTWLDHASRDVLRVHPRVSGLEAIADVKPVLHRDVRER